jgi:bacillithiol system protein YtxJ
MNLYFGKIVIILIFKENIMNWIALSSNEQLETIKAESYSHTVLIFKHSTTCSISAMSLSRFERKFDATKVANLKCYYLDLKAYRDVSDAIATVFEVEHESPQVLLIENGLAVYNASHYEISFDDIAVELA